MDVVELSLVMVQLRWLRLRLFLIAVDRTLYLLLRHFLQRFLAAALIVQLSLAARVALGVLYEPFWNRKLLVSTWIERV